MSGSVQPATITDADGIKNQLIPFIPAHGIAPPCNVIVLGMPTAVGERPSKRVMNLVEEGNLAGTLNDLEWKRGVKRACWTRWLTESCWIVRASMLLKCFGAEWSEWRRAAVRARKIRRIRHLPDSIEIWNAVPWRR